MQLALSIFAAGFLAHSGVQDDRLGAEDLVQQVWKFLPAYDGEHRYFLSAEAFDETLAAAHLAQAASALDPKHVRALWSAGHAHALLAEDRKNRGLSDDALSHYDESVRALTRAMQLDASDPWASYARGAAHTSFGYHALALADFELAVANADRILARGQDTGSVGWIRFKALEWRTEVLMRLGEHERARAALKDYHGEFSSNRWPLQIALAESHLRERDFQAAREVYEATIAQFPSDHQAYALAGYVAGLVNDRELAATRLSKALEHELVPGMYTRLWLWILADGELRAVAEDDLASMLENPPDSVSSWDQRLGNFTLGTGDVDEFLVAARVEERRRMDAAVTLDDLMCEVWFYAGLRLEHDAASAEDRAQAATLQASALDAYAAALAFDPPKWKWEWAYARLHYAGLSSALGRSGAPDLVVDGSSITIAGLSGEMEDVSWHEPGAERPNTALGRELQPGDLLLFRVRTEDGRVAQRRVVLMAD